MQFVSKHPRETKGSDTSGKYDYQKDLSICLLLQHHSDGEDYLFIFDYHDDLVILNSETAPTETKFFQIKAHDKGAYTLSKLLARKKGKRETSASILGKLYGHLVDFPEEVKSLNFITNLEFSIPYGLKDNCRNYSEVCLKDISSKSLATLEKKLGVELGIPSINEEFKKIAFLKTNSLSVKDSSGHTKGKLAEFLQAKYPGVKNNTDLLYQNIFDEVKRKSRYDKVVASLPELARHKGISRSYFTKILAIAGASQNQEAIWGRIEAALTTEGLPVGTVLHYAANWKRLEVERMNPTNGLLKEAITSTKAIVQRESPGFRGKSLLEITDAIRSQLTKFTPVLSDDQLTILIFAELYG